MKSFLASPWTSLERALGSVRFWCGIYLYCAAVLAWSMRHLLGHDGLSYLDLASDALSGGPAALVNGYWSPGYPALLSIGLFLIRPSPGQEFPVVHVVNFVISMFTLWGFLVFFRYWSAATHGDDVAHADEKKYITPFAFCTFLWFTLSTIGSRVVTPDLAVAGIVFLAAGICCRLSLPGSSLKHHAALGAVLGIGYYLKAVMFPLGVVLLVLLFLLLPRSKGATRRNLSISLAVMLLVAAPLVAALSARAHTLTFGEAGRLNYVWFVNRLPTSTGWIGGTADVNGSPTHPPRTLMERPLVLEFASPIKGTYPLWYDPSYWYAGAQARFDLSQQIATLKITLLEYKDILLESMAFVSGTLVLSVVGLRQKRHPLLSRSSWWQLAWPLFACATYGLVHVEARFLAAFFVLFWLAIYRALMFRVDKWVMMAVCGTVLGTVMPPFATRVATETVRIAKDSVFSTMPDYQKAALDLGALGLASGDRLAIVGVAEDCYYCRYARLRVVALIPNAQEFQGLSAPELRSVAERLASNGVKAVVALNRTDASADWKDVKGSDSMRLSVLLLSPTGINQAGPLTQ